jgi:hypothetical protein
MTRQLFKLILLILITFSLWLDIYSQTADKPGSKIQNVYRVSLGEQAGKKVWIVDGLVIRRDIFGEFLYGGNPQRYPWIPKNEIWIDHAISAEEFKYTLMHELHERDLMAKKGMSYADAHDSSLAVERNLRLYDFRNARIHESKLPKVKPVDCEGIKEIASLPDSILLRQIYRQFITSRDSINVWIVDGATVRRDIFPDFGLSGNDLAYHFIPKNEIWVDGQISCEETRFSIIAESVERQLMAKGMGYDEAYTTALNTTLQYRMKELNSAKQQRPVIISKDFVRDVGTGNEK